MAPLLRMLTTLVLTFLLVLPCPFGEHTVMAAGRATPAAIPGFRNSEAQRALETQFLAVPDPKRAEEHLQILTKAPHMAGTAEDKATAEYVSGKFREAGLETEIVEYRIWLNYPSEISVELTGPAGATMHGPAHEHVEGDPFQDDPRVVMPFNGMSPSGDVEADIVYANYGTPEDFQKLRQLKVDVKGKIVLMRYGQNFRGVKELLAQENGAAGVLIYSDPYDDGWRRGDKYPNGPWRPDSGVQRGSIGYMFHFPGDPTTPGIASLPSLPDEKRTPPDQSAQLPRIPCTPISYAEAWPILEHLGGQGTPREWQGSLPFTYHIGPGPARVKLHLKQDYQYRTIWNVIGRVKGAELPDDWVVVGNHRDAWVYGAVDPNSGTAAMLEAVHGVGELLKSGWRPKRTIVFGSWDAEEEGLIGSTEWGEQHETELAHAVAYFNVDVAVSGPKFGASAVPSLKQFVRDIAKVVPSPQGGMVYDIWTKPNQAEGMPTQEPAESIGDSRRLPVAQSKIDAPVGDLGSGSDYTVFLQHLAVPSTDVSSTGPYGVYHSVFDNFNWFKKFGDPDFLYVQEIARVLGLEAIRMANVDILPYDYAEYAQEITTYLEKAKKKANSTFNQGQPPRGFDQALHAANKLQHAGERMLKKQNAFAGDLAQLNRELRNAESALLLPAGLPDRPWFRHAIYAPGRYTGYAAVVIPGVNEAIDKHDQSRMEQQLAEVTSALDRAAKALEGN